MAVINYHDQTSLSRKGFMSSYNSQVAVHFWGKSGQEFKARMEAEALKEHCSLACRSWITPLALLQYAVPLARDSTAHNELVPPISIIKKMNIGLPTGHSGGDIFSFAVPSFKMILACFNLLTRSSE